MSFYSVRANLAIMSIFRGLHVPALGRLEMAQLRACWPRYALRRRDLDLGVERLESLGLVELDRRRDGSMYVILTSMGYRSAYSLLTVLQVVITLPRRILQGIASLKGRAATQPPRRRLLDRAADTPPHLDARR